MKQVLNEKYFRYPTFFIKKPITILDQSLWGRPHKTKVILQYWLKKMVRRGWNMGTLKGEGGIHTLFEISSETSVTFYLTHSWWPTLKCHCILILFLAGNPNQSEIYVLLWAENPGEIFCVQCTHRGMRWRYFCCWCLILPSWPLLTFHTTMGEVRIGLSRDRLGWVL